MLYDLNIPWSPSTTASDLDRTLSFAAHLGYTVVALNRTLTPPIQASLPNPLPLPQPSSTKLTLLRRATIPVSDPATNHRLPLVASAYDLVALRPTTERAFTACCTSLAAEHFALISLDLTAFFPFHFAPRACAAAVARGLRFEICYGQFLAAGAAGDARGRANFLSNVAGLVRATRGKGLVVSSEAASALGLRAPADVVNLLAVWGLGPERGREALGINPRGVVMNEGLRRRGFRGVVDVLEGAAGAEEGKEKRKGEEGQKGKKEKAKSKDKRQLQGQKRRNGEGADAAPTDGDAPLSKRQAKKMRLAAMKEKPAAES